LRSPPPLGRPRAELPHAAPAAVSVEPQIDGDGLDPAPVSFVEPASRYTAESSELGIGPADRVAIVVTTA
jgi:hypothetical protein